MPRKLPVFQGYTIDVRLLEFRKLIYGEKFEIIPFNSSKGIDLIRAFEKEIERRQNNGG
jgi:hypothetical protein